MSKLPITLIDITVSKGRHSHDQYYCFVGRGVFDRWQPAIDPAVRHYMNFSLSTLARLHRAQMKLAV